MSRIIDLTRYQTVRKCQNCGSSKSHTNPFWKCYECKGRFCSDCIWGGQLKSDMKQGEEVRDICDKCRGKEYHSLNE